MHRRTYQELGLANLITKAVIKAKDRIRVSRKGGSKKVGEINSFSFHETMGNLVQWSHFALGWRITQKAIRRLEPSKPLMPWGQESKAMEGGNSRKCQNPHGLHQHLWAPWWATSQAHLHLTCVENLKWVIQVRYITPPLICKISSPHPSHICRLSWQPTTLLNALRFHLHVPHLSQIHWLWHFDTNPQMRADPR